MTTTIIIGQPKTFKKAYSVVIKERGIKPNGDISFIVLGSTRFQIRDLEGNSTLQIISEKLQKALSDIITDAPKYDEKAESEDVKEEKEIHFIPHKKPVRRTKKEYKKCIRQAIEYAKKGLSIEEALKKALGRYVYYNDKLTFQKMAKISALRLKSNKIENIKKDWRSLRGSFLMTRMKFLMNQYNYSREKALLIAVGEWTEHRKQNKELPKNEIQKPIPKILKDENVNKILIDMLSAVARQHTRLQKRPDGDAIGITTKSEWDYLVDKIFMHITEIADYLDVPNRFKIVMFEEDKCVTYE